MTTTVNVSNGGPNKVRVTGGTLSGHFDVLSGTSQSFTVTDTVPLAIAELPSDGGGLSGGHGEE